MGAACCRCQQVAFEDDALRFPRPATPRRHASRAATRDASSPNTSLLTRASIPHRSTRARRPSRQSVTMNHSLANYVGFPFPFANKTPAKKTTKAKSATPTSPRGRNYKPMSKKKSKSASRATVLEMLPSGLGDHFVKNEQGETTPLSLVELCVRRVCASLVADPECYAQTWPSTRRTCIPSEVASAVLVYLKRHEVLSRDHFRFLARYMFHEWNLQSQLDVDSSWFNDIGVAPLQYIKSIDFTNCPNLTSLGSDRWLQVDELPNLMTASFQDCDKLSKCVPDILQSSTRLTSLSLAGCRNIDDRSLLALRRLFRLKTLDLSGCGEITDEGFKCLTSLSKMEKLVLSRCNKLTDQAFEDTELAFPNLHHLDVAHCRITDVALAHFGHVVSLTTLIVRGCRHLTDSGIERLASLKALEHFDARHCEDIRSLRSEWSNMQVLLLSRSAFGESETAVLKSMENIVELDMKACRILKRGYEFINKLAQLKRLTLAETPLTDSALIQICKGIRGLIALDISHTEITDAGTEGLAYLVDLEDLRMDTNGITNRSLVHVSGLKKLRHLDLFGTSVSDNGVLHLTGLRNLRVLEICSGSITDRGVELISRLKTLRTLNLSQNRYINTKGVQHLRALTHLKHLNLSGTAVSADSFRHLQPLKELESLSIYGCELTAAQVEMLQETLPKLRCLRCS